MSERGILCFKPALRLEERGNHVQQEGYQRDHSLTLCDSATQSKRMRFSIHTTVMTVQRPRLSESLGHFLEWRAAARPDAAAIVSGDETSLDRPRIGAVVGELVPAYVPEHMRMNPRRFQPGDRAALCSIIAKPAGSYSRTATPRPRLRARHRAGRKGRSLRRLQRSRPRADPGSFRGVAPRGLWLQ
jgi:hypothetical protein